MTILFLLSTILLFPFLTGLISYLITRPTFPITKMPALLFHSVNRDEENGLSHIHPDLFENFLKLLSKRNIDTATLSEAFLDNRINNKIALVFDDGFEDFYTEAFPLLKKYKCTATLFPVTKSIDCDFSWDLYSKRNNLSSKQIKEISEYGIEIGSHTHSHPDLTRISDKNLKDELSESKKILEDITEKKVIALSFPFGSWNKRVWRTAKTSGYTIASAYRGLKHNEKSVMNVIGIYSFDTLETIMQKSGLKKLTKSVYLKGKLMPHFAKGTALWSFRKNYSLLSRT